MRPFILTILILAGCGETLPAPIVQCASPSTYVPAYQQCGSSLDGLPCVTRIGNQVNEAGVPLPTECTEQEGGSQLSFVVSSCGECQ